MFGCSARSARLLRCGASTMVLGAALLQANPAFAQNQPTSDTAGTPLSQSTTTQNQTPPSAPEKNAIIVTGQRRALRTSQQIKKNADTVVDSITATDIGQFPDKSVAEALQRVPGITVNRFAATGDTSHFSAEPSGVLIRGLPQVRSEFNGRDTFSANSGRGLNWSDVTPELLAGVDAYKNQTADMIEGGIAGTVDLRTRVPFDAPGQLIEIGVRANYGDLAKKWTPDANVFYSNRWQTGIGEIGIMGDVAYSRVMTETQGNQLGRIGIFNPGVFPDSANVTSNNFATGTVMVPTQVTFRQTDYDRKRTGISAAAQWRSNDHKWLLTGQFLRSNYNETWREHTFGANLYSLFQVPVTARETSSTVQPAPGSPPFTFDNSGLFTSGTITNGPDTYFAPNTAFNDQGIPMFNNCYSWNSWTGTPYGYTYPGGPVCSTNDYGAGVYDSSRYANQRNMTQDAALNLKWDPTNDLHFNFDGQYIDSTIKDYDIEGDLASFQNVTYDMTGQYPRLSFSDPTNINLSAGGLSNPSNWYLNSLMDHLEDSHGHEYALRADGEWDFHSEWLDSLKFGGRYADRKQLVQWSTYNWQNVANTYTGSNCEYLFYSINSKPGTCGNITFNGYPAGAFQNYNFGTTFAGGGNLGSFPFMPFNFLENKGANLFSPTLTGVGQFVPICERNGQIPGITPVELPNSCFTAGEVANVEEATTAAYAMLKFGGDDAKIGGIAIHGNIGVRYVRTIDDSTGSIGYPTVPGINAADCPPVALVPGGLTGTGTKSTTPGAPYPSFCYLTPQDLNFANGAIDALTARTKHSNWLPSFNLRADVAPNWIVRFAASEAMSRPDIGLLKNFQRLSMGLPGANLTDPGWILDANGNPIGVTPAYLAQSFNPYLKPITAWNYDISFEHYFGKAGQISLDLFAKKFNNYIQYGIFNLQETNNGVTRTVQFSGPANGKGAKLQGLEADYTSFFDFLPKPFDGLGLQANFTYVKNQGVQNTSLGTPTAPSNLNSNSANSALDPGTLEGLSKYTANIVGMYEKGPISARVAYNWRSQYLVTALDCCTLLPVWQKAAGFLDASIRYSITPSIELSVQGSNLLNTKTVLLQQVTDKNSPEHKIILAPNAWFENDRTFIVGIRWKMASSGVPVAPPPVALPPPPPPGPATQTCPNGSVILATATCPAAAAPPPPPPATAPERGY